MNKQVDMCSDKRWKEAKAEWSGRVGEAGGAILDWMLRGPVVGFGVAES